MKFLLVCILLLRSKPSLSQGFNLSDIFPLENSASSSRLAVKILKSNFAVMKSNSNKTCIVPKVITPAEEGCDAIRNESYKFSLPITTTKDFDQLVKQSGGMEKFREKYGLFPPSDEQKSGPNSELPMGFTLSADKKTVSFNCFLCHGQAVGNKSIEGGANSKLRFQELYSDFKDKPLKTYAYSWAIGNTGFENYAGATSAFDMSLFSSQVRSQDSGNLNYFSVIKAISLGMIGQNYKPVPVYATPWWNNAPGLKGATFYSAANSSQSAGHLMQFALASELDGSELKALVPLFDKILACVKDKRPPTVTLVVNQSLARKGRQIFQGSRSPDQNCNCAKCHGTTDAGEYNYLEKKIKLSFVKTDSALALRFADPEKLDHHNKVVSSITKNSAASFESASGLGYIAPPLVALFTKSALLHNHSVPTMKELLCTKAVDRASRWSLKEGANIFDEEGLTRNPPINFDLKQTVYDTNKQGFSNSGHDFCDLLKEDPVACSEITEYLKTL